MPVPFELTCDCDAGWRLLGSPIGSGRFRDSSTQRGREHSEARRVGRDDGSRGEFSSGSWSGRAAMPQHRRGHEPGPKQNLRRAAKPCLLEGPQCSTSQELLHQSSRSVRVQWPDIDGEYSGLVVGLQAHWSSIVKNSDNRFRQDSRTGQETCGNREDLYSKPRRGEIVKILDSSLELQVLMEIPYLLMRS